MNDLQIFNFDKQEVRTLVVDETPLFVANDVARTLGYMNPSKATNDHCKKAILTWGNDSLGRRQEFKVIPESDVYRLVFRSKLPEAERFEEWVTSEVLPTIRKTGGYQVPQDPMSALKLMFEATEQTKTDVKRVESRVDELEENAPLSPGEYSFIGKRISQKVFQVGRERSFNMNKKQKAELFKALNSEIASITGVRTRTQLKTKHFDQVIDFIDDWEPSKATTILVKQLDLLEEEA